MERESRSGDGIYLDTIAALERQLEATQEELDALRRRRPGAMANLLHDAFRGLVAPREAVRRARAIVNGEHTHHPSTSPTTDALLRDVPSGVEFTGPYGTLGHDYPYLRVGHLGTASRFAQMAPHVELRRDTFQQDLERGLDLVLIEPEGDRFDLPQAREIASVARRKGVPVVWIRATLGPGPSIDAGDVVFDGADDLPPPLDAFTDPRIWNPIGWRRQPSLDATILRPTSPSERADRIVSEVSRQLGSVAVHRLPEVRPDPGTAAGRAAALPAILDSLRESHVVILTGFEETTARALSVHASGMGIPVLIGGQADGVVLAHTVSSDPNDLIDAAVALKGDLDQRERLSVPHRRHVLCDRTSRRAFEAILGELDIPLRPDPLVSVLLSTNRPHRLNDALAEIEGQTYRDLEVVVVLHGDGFDLDAASHAATELGLSTQFVEAPERWLLGDCLNAGLDACSGDLVTKFDDDDLYGPEHITDLVCALEYSGADVVGKLANFVRLEDHDVTMIHKANHQERFVDHLPGGTIMARRTWLDQVGFKRVPSSEDRELLRSMKSLGGSAYSTHRFNYTRVRHGDHTFARPDGEFARSSEGVAIDAPRTITEA